MADIELVIKIPEEAYKHLLEEQNLPNGLDLEYFIIHGIPLPKGHGRLIDVEKLPLNAIDDANYGSNYIRIAPTIIEADKESEDKE